MNNTYYTNTVSVTEIEQGLMFKNSIMIASLVTVVIIGLVMIISMYKIFKNSGEKGYKAFIPIYNIITLMKIVDMPLWYFILLFIPVVNIFITALMNVKLANKFNKSALFAVGLLFLPFIFYPVLAVVSSSKEGKEKKVKVKEDKKIEKTKDNDGIICPVCATVLAPDADTCFVCNSKLSSDNADKVIDQNQVQSSSAEFMTNLDEVPLDKFDQTMPNVNVNINDILEDEVVNTSPVTDNVKVDLPLHNPLEEVSVPVNENVEMDMSELHPMTEVNMEEVVTIPEANEVTPVVTEVKEELIPEVIKEIPVEVVPEVQTDDLSIFTAPVISVENEIKEETPKVVEELPKDVKEILDNNIDLSVSENFVVKEPERKYVSSSKTLDEILKINNKIYEDQRKNQEMINKQNEEKEEEMFKDIESILMQVENVVPETEEIKTEEKIETPVIPSNTEGRKCKTCGSIIPEFSDTCLLCGTPYNN